MPAGMQLPQFAQKVISEHEDAEDLICSETPTYNRVDLRNASKDILTQLIMEGAAFCCSFKEGDKMGQTFEMGALARTLSLSQGNTMMQVEEEVSAFQDEIMVDEMAKE